MSTENTLRGWVPVKFVFRSGEMCFRWMDFSSIDISEPFFRHTLERMTKLGTQEKTSSVRRLIEIGNSIPPIRPSCLIFHVSRCGSTLLTNALRATGHCIALSEPRIITDLFHFCHDLPASALELRDSILQSVVNLYASCHGAPRSIVIKLASWNLLSLSTFRRIWPETPCILLIRDPGEVIISNLKPGGWLAFKSEPACGARLLELNEAQVAQMSEVEFCARVVKKLNEAALEGIDAEWMIIDYNMLDAGLMPTILDFVGLDQAALDWDAVQSTFRMYAKDQDGIKVFENDREEKRRKANQLITGSSADLAKESYNSLHRMTLTNLPNQAVRPRQPSGSVQKASAPTSPSATNPC
jgi:hypothetical protein